MKKRMLSLLLCGAMCTGLLSGCGNASSAEVLNVYNWGEYIDESVIDEFEAETGIHVTYDLFETNEEMYPVIEAGAVNYDAVCPSDYMIQKMVENGLLAEINFETPLIPTKTCIRASRPRATTSLSRPTTRFRALSTRICSSRSTTTTFPT